MQSLKTTLLKGYLPPTAIIRVTGNKRIPAKVTPFLPVGSWLLSLLIMLGIWSGPSASAESVENSAWQHRIAIYLWGAGLDGRTGNRLDSGDVEVDFSDIMENFEAGFMLNYRGKREKWGVGLDVIYLNIGPSPDRPPADVDMKQWIVDATGHYEVAPGLELLAGARFVDLDMEAKLDVPLPIPKITGNETWTDPIVGAEYRGAFGAKWRYLLRGDVGGFGVNSDLTWQLAGYIGYQPSGRWIVYGGYRHLKIDYESDGSNEFFYDMAVSGPLVGVGFGF